MSKRIKRARRRLAKRQREIYRHLGHYNYYKEASP